MSSAPVTIVGAGPSGLTLAWWLIQHGHAVTVLERESTVPKDMRASTFHPATLDFPLLLKRFQRMQNGHLD